MPNAQGVATAATRIRPHRHFRRQRGQPGGAWGAEAETDRRVETKRILSHLSARRDLPRFRTLDEKEIRDLGAPELLHWHAVWRVDDLIGALRVLAPGVAASAADLAATVIAQERRTCRGLAFSGTMTDKFRPDVVFLFAACEAGASRYDACYAIVPRAQDGYYLSGMVARGRSDERMASMVMIDTFLRVLSERARTLEPPCEHGRDRHAV